MIPGFAAVAAGRRRTNPEVEVWRARVIAAGGGFTANSVDLANGLMYAIQNESYGAKILYLLPLLGTGIAAAQIPLRDTLNVGAAANTAFVDADFSETTGLKGNGSSKMFDLLIKPSQLDSNNGGLGYWENQVSYAGSSSDCPMGCRDDANHQAKLFIGSTYRGFYWGLAANGIIDSPTPGGNGHYYGRRDSATSRDVFFNGSNLGSNTTSDTAAWSGERNILLMAHSNTAPVFWNGRCAVAYLTAGGITTPQVAAFHTLLSNYLITPTGR